MKKAISGLVLTGLLTLGVATSGAHAEVIYDATTGTGFVGKGDVQLALGYNNAQMQSNAGNLVFTTESEDKYDIVVEWDTDAGKKIIHHEVTRHKTQSFSDVISYDAKTKKQVVGFNLTGIASETVGGYVPQVGEEFGGPGQLVTEVNVVSHTESGLEVNGVSLTPAPVADPITQ